MSKTSSNKRARTNDNDEKQPESSKPKRSVVYASRVVMYGDEPSFGAKIFSTRKKAEQDQRLVLENSLLQFTRHGEILDVNYSYPLRIRIPIGSMDIPQEVWAIWSHSREFSEEMNSKKRRPMSDFSSRELEDLYSTVYTGESFNDEPHGVEEIEIDSGIMMSFYQP